MSNLSISVAMCTFNGARFVGAQLESIAAQDRPPDELVICDDGSSDATLEIVRDFSRRSGLRICLVVNDCNRGSTRNFEQAISLCQGNIVALADQDDVWYPHKLRRIEEAFARSTERTEPTVAVFSDADLLDCDGRPLGSRLWATVRFTPPEQRAVLRDNGLQILLKHPVVTGATMAFPRELFDGVVPIPPDETHDRWISFLLATRGRLEPISEPLMQYRRHSAQQIGPGPLDLRRSIKQASSRGAKFYEEEIVHYQRFADRVRLCKTRRANTLKTLDEIEKKIAHLERRARLPRPKLARIPLLLREVMSGDYWRYSGGWRSVAKDFVLR